MIRAFCRCFGAEAVVERGSGEGKGSRGGERSLRERVGRRGFDRFRARIFLSDNIYSF